MNISKRDKRIIMILTIFTIVFTFFGASLAYWSWETTSAQKTNIVFKLTQDFSCAADGGGDITQADAFIAPAKCTSSTHAIKREVKVTPTIMRDGLSITTELFLDVKQMGSGLSNSQNFKYALTTNSDSCTEGVLSSGTFKGKSTGSKVRILSKNYSSSTPETYYLYVWLDEAESSTSTMDQKFSLSMSGNCFDVVEPEAPVIDEGMIPVTLSSNGTVKTVQPGDPNWYDYENKEWANVVLVYNDSRSIYQDTSGVTVNQEDILAYYVWIPRYSYRIPRKLCSSIDNPTVEGNPTCFSYIVSDQDKASLINFWYSWHSYEVQLEGLTYTMEQAEEDIEIMLSTGSVYIEEGDDTYLFTEIHWLYEDYESDMEYTTEFLPGNTIIDGPREIDIEFESTTSIMQMGDAVNTYRTHPAFWWDDNSDGDVDVGEMVAGIWVGKFETTAYGTMPTILPERQSMRNNSVSNQFLMSQEFSASGNIYGLSNASTNAHMMKNTEWGAVAYLSHSKYGINSEIRINNSENFETGCGASSENSELTSVCEISYNSESTPQSTTGNITGIFDMSGGSSEYVMGVLADSDGNPRSGGDVDYNSGFNGIVNVYNDDDSISEIMYTSGVNFPASKYYDLYTSENSTTACNGGSCYGHALSETAYWYGDYDNFVRSSTPWFVRGGSLEDGSSAGAFYSSNGDGGASGGASWRSVLVVGYGA